AAARGGPSSSARTTLWSGPERIWPSPTPSAISRPKSAAGKCACALRDRSGVARTVVEVPVTPRSQLLKRQPHVLEERGLELVDEEGGGGLERAEQKQAVPNAGAVHHFLNPLGDVQEILACFRSDTDRVPAPLHRRPPIAGYASQ